MYKKIISCLYDNGDEEKAIKMASYMKDNFIFLGIPKPKRGELYKDFIKQAKKQNFIDWDLIFMLWDLPTQEFQYFAIYYLIALKDNLKKEDIDNIKLLIVSKSWWDTVDTLAGNIMGTICYKYPELIKTHIFPWSESYNIWLVRVAILFQLKYKEKTDAEVLSLIIKKNNNNSKEFFVNKTIGWALREYSKTNKEWVGTFIKNTSLLSLSIREGSQYL